MLTQPRLVWLLALASLASLHCSSETTTGGNGGGSAGGGGAQAGGGGADAEGGGAEGGGAEGGAAPEDPCSIEALAEPTAATTYYLAIGEPGADNEACDGLAPTDEGGGHCPFKD